MSVHAILAKPRLEALTDGIFAVTLTLLVLDVHFPERFSGPLRHELLGLVDLLDNYVISFVVLAVIWMGHLRLMRRVTEPDSRFVAQNLAFLFLTTLVPRLTTLLGDHPDQPHAALLYGGNLFLLLLCELAMWHRALHRLRHAADSEAGRDWQAVRSRYLLALGVVLTGIAAALVEIELTVSRGISAWLYLLLLGLGAVRLRVRLPRPGRPASARRE